MDKKTPWFLHVDLDAFFASVEQLDHPEYKGKPVIVGGMPDDKRSVVSTASYEARKFGVHSAMPTYQAYKLCPQGIYVYGRMQRYAELSYQIMTIFKDYSPDVIQMSIDEAFIDITGTEKLFGPPEETAMQIKARVKKDTGLTVSVGLATTKYLAKIASGFSKPDGFYFVKPGTEQQFMMDLPLNKVWGVGDKTLERLKSSGINSTRDIYEKSFDSLEFMFGNNTANFLYNVVRGIDVVGFGHEAKKHSLSAETTFPYDIKDTYTAETQLLNLCHGVVFRLMRENSFSRTAHLKIRYDDFSTVSIQETVDRSILTVDSFFEIIKRLFERKYEAGRGIRLLGVGFDNVEKEDKPYQQDLFDSGNAKKQAVEKAILKLEKKHPEVKVQKARMLDGKQNLLALILLSGMLLFSPQKLSAQKVTTKEITGAGPVSTESAEPDESEAIYNWEISDSNKVELLFAGFWKVNLTAGLNSSFGNGTGFNAGTSLPVFTQEIDLSSWILLNNTWYFQADFADNFEKNTLAMGYIGNSYLKSARISNRGIIMPQEYAASYFGFGLGGGNNQAPGLSLHFEDPFKQKWHGDFVFRYDMTKTNSATFYGKNSVTDLKIQPSDFMYGKNFILPEEAAGELQHIKAVYVENSNGSFRDKNGKKYKQLSQSDYLVIQGSSKIILNTSAQGYKQDYKIPVILVTFTDTSSVSKIIASTGSYSNPTTFAGKIQSYFNTYDNAVDLEQYSYKLDSEIEGDTALVLQNSILFSPYLCSNLYDCGILPDAELLITSISTEKTSSEYYAEQVENDLSALDQDFFEENHLLAQVSNLNITDSSLQNPAVRYPFADAYPELYLNLPAQTDLQLIVRSFSEISDFQIGTEAINGTVQVYINNQLDSGASYNQETGIVSLSQNVNNTDKIYILWQEDSSNFAGGSLVAGTGLFLNITPNLSLDFAITTRWPVVNYENYSTSDSKTAGFAAVSGGVGYHTENITLEQKTAVSIKSNDATGNLLVMEHQETAPQTYYLSNDAGFITKSAPFISDSDGLVLNAENNYTIPSHGGMSDSKITGYKIPLGWNFNGADVSTATPWAAVDVKLENGYELSSAANLELALQALIPEDAVPFYDVYLQLGVTASEDSVDDTSYNLPVWKLTGFEDANVITPVDLSNRQWQTVIISLSNQDRAKLASSSDARLIVVAKDSIPADSSGFLFFGPYEPKKQSLFTQQNENIYVNAFSEKALNTPSAQKLQISSSYATKLNWNIPEPDKVSSDSKITATSYFQLADFNSYSTINLDFDATTTGELQFLLDSDSGTAVELTIYELAACVPPFSENPAFHKLTINTDTLQVYIDDVLIETSKYNLKLNKSIIPNKFTLVIDTKYKDVIQPSGTVYIGNLYYSESSPYFGTQNYFLAKYSSNETLVKVHDYSLISKPEITLSSAQGISGKTTQNITGDISANASGGITVADIRYSADVSTNKVAGHSIESEKKLLNFLTFGEAYRFNNLDSSLNKTDKIGFDFSNPILPVKFSFETTGKDLSQNRTQNSNGNASIQAKIKKTTIGLESKAEVTQKINLNKTVLSPFNTENYFDGWYDISTLQFSSGNENATSRTESLNSKFYVQLPYYSIKPELQYQLQALYQNLSETSLTDTTTLAFIQPFVVRNNAFSFNIKRTGGGTAETQSGGNYISDSQAIANSYNKRNWLYTTAPFYDLFDKELNKKLINSTPAAETSKYAGLYEINWKRRLSNTINDLFIPSATTVAFSRELIAGSSISDLYQLKVVLSNTALNCFGSQSSIQLFDWYEQDEIMGNITCLFKFPQGTEKAASYSITAYEQLLFYITTNATLKAAFDLSVDSNKNWNTKATSIWSRPGTESIIADLITLKMQNQEKLDIKITRKEIVNISLGQSDKKFKQKYDYTHSTDFNFLQYYTLTTGIGTTVISTQKAATNVGMTLSLGGKIEF